MHMHDLAGARRGTEPRNSTRACQSSRERDYKYRNREKQILEKVSAHYRDTVVRSEVATHPALDNASFTARESSLRRAVCGRGRTR